MNEVSVEEQQKPVEEQQKEVLRLLELQEKYINEIIKSGLLGTEEKTTFTKSDAEDFLRILNNEKGKVSKLEMTLAVVGTMKAGKSTTINAIVGIELLPSRNTAMTILPTIIRHTPKQTKPILTYKNHLSLKTVIDKLHKNVNSASENTPLENNILERAKAFKIKGKYVGTEQIFEFLHILNDLIRYYAENMDLQKFRDIDDLPVIEVEFICLRKQRHFKNGQFSLIDTPGSNEYGKVYLADVMRDQLKKASAVLSILDYSQLDTTSDADVRHEINKVIEDYQSRLFVLVNKFDNYNSSSMDEQETKNLVKKKFFKENHVLIDNIYPVSSKKAYLSTMAKKIRKLPDDKQQKNLWLKDYAKLAFEYDVEKMKDIKEVKKRAEIMSKNSNFSKPLEDIMTYVSYHGATEIIQSALNKMKFYNKKAFDLIHLRKNNLEKDIKIEEIEANIKNLEETLKKVDEVKKNFDQTIENNVKKLNNEINMLFNEIDYKIKKCIERFFLSITKTDSIVTNIKNEIKEIYYEIASKIPYCSNSNKIMVFNSKEEAENYLIKIKNAIILIFEERDKNLENNVRNRLINIHYTISREIAENIKDTIRDAEKRINETFDTTFIINPFKLEKIHFSLKDVSYAAKTEKYEQKYYERRWYTLWLYKHETTATHLKDKFVVDLNEIKKKISDELEKQKNDQENKVNNYIENEIKNKINNYFAKLSDYLKKFQGNLRSAVDDNLLKKDNYKKQLLTNLELFFNKLSQHQKDIIVHIKQR